MSDSDTYTVQRSTTVQAPPGRLFEQVEDFHRWPAWSPWEGLDPAIRRTFVRTITRGTGENRFLLPQKAYA